jgi:hypothetical protein
MSCAAQVVIVLTPLWSRKLLPSLLNWITEEGHKDQPAPGACTGGALGRPKRPVVTSNSTKQS